MTYSRQKDVALGGVARTLLEDRDLFAVLADPLAFACRSARFPSGPAIVFADVPEIPETFIEEEMECERWDGLS